MDNLEQIYNYEKVTEQIGSSGQPTRDQFALIKDAGYDAVVNLALPTSDTALPDEGSVVTGLEMDNVWKSFLSITKEEIVR